MDGLEQLYVLLSDSNRWIKGNFCLYEDDSWCSKIANGYKFCLYGAVCYLDLPQSDRDKLHTVIKTLYNFPDMTTFNDHKNTTHEMVLSVIDKARKL